MRLAEGEAASILEVLAEVQQHGVMLKGPLTIPPASPSIAIPAHDLAQIANYIPPSLCTADGIVRFSSANQVFRKVLQLSSNVRPVAAVPGVTPPRVTSGGPFDWIVFRENTEDVYTGIEEERPHAVWGRKVNSVAASRAIGAAAGAAAVAQRRRRVTLVHKANVCKKGDGLFLREARDAAAALLAGTDIVLDDQLADSLFCRAVQAPWEYDVLVCPNLFGDLLSDMAGGLAGSLGLCGSANLGNSVALFEPAHGSAPDIAGRGIANPTSTIFSAVLMLRHLGNHAAATLLDTATRSALSAGEGTPDLPNSRATATTASFARAVDERMADLA